MLIGLPDAYRECGLPHDPCTYHRHVADAIRSDEGFAAHWQFKPGRGWVGRRHD